MPTSSAGTCTIAVATKHSFFRIQVLNVVSAILDHNSKQVQGQEGAGESGASTAGVPRSTTTTGIDVFGTKFYPSWYLE